MSGVICDVNAQDLAKHEYIPCLNYEISSPTNETKTYEVIINVQEQGGSQDDVYIMIQGLNGRLTDPFNVGAMADGGRLYSFDLTSPYDVGEPKAVYHVKLKSDGDDALLVKGCSIDNLSTEEFDGDLLEYTGTDARGCGYVKCDFIKDEVSKGEEDICNIIPFITPVGNGTNTQYFIHFGTIYVQRLVELKMIYG